MINQIEAADQWSYLSVEKLRVFRARCDDSMTRDRVLPPVLDQGQRRSLLDKLS